jgi:hypothetical protein
MSLGHHHSLTHWPIIGRQTQALEHSVLVFWSNSNKQELILWGLNFPHALSFYSLEESHTSVQPTQTGHLDVIYAGVHHFFLASTGYASARPREPSVTITKLCSKLKPFYNSHDLVISSPCDLFKNVLFGSGVYILHVA